MGDFGAETLKPTWLYCNFAGIGDIDLFKTTKFVIGNSKQIVKKSRRADGTIAVSGGPGLKATQTYPEGFGEAIAMLRKRMDAHVHLHATMAAAKSRDVAMPRLFSPALDKWEDANLGGIFARLWG